MSLLFPLITSSSNPKLNFFPFSSPTTPTRRSYSGNRRSPTTGEELVDFNINKKILEVAIIPSKRLRNKIAGFSTHLMKRIQKGPVRGVSLKLQEEEREAELPRIVLKEDVPVVSGGIPGGYGGGGRSGFGGGAGRRWIQVQHYKFNLCFVLFYMFLITCFYLIFVIVLRFGSSIS
ncbi:putative ribosomal protein S17e [Helianthus anomalus]